MQIGRWFYCLTTIAALIFSSLPIEAQTFPDRTIRLVVPFAPGGNLDPVARIAAPAMSKFLGQQVIVENKAGAGGWIGSQQVARAAADGYSLLLSSSGVFTIAPLLYADRMGFDAIKDFTSVGGIAAVDIVLVVGPSVQAKTFAELVAVGKERPGRLTVSTAGDGTTSHLLAAMFEQALHQKVTLVPYKGGAQIVGDVAAGQVDLTFGQVPFLASLVNAGKLRALAVLSDRRSPTLPNIPTTTELGFPQLQAKSFFGISAPSAIPAGPLASLRSALARAMAEPETKKALEQIDALPLSGAPPEYDQMINDDLSRWKKVIDESKLKPSEN